MGRLQAYPIEYSEDKLNYRFISKGAENDIVKIVTYEDMKSDEWNLAFGDANADETDFDDKIITNNQDMRRVIQTVFATGLIFSAAYPERKIKIVPVDRQRKLLYNRVFQDRHTAIEEFYTVYGLSFTGDTKELYDSRKIYEGI
jgi:hypothetical protein